MCECVCVRVCVCVSVLCPECPRIGSVNIHFPLENMIANNVLAVRAKCFAICPTRDILFAGHMENQYPTRAQKYMRRLTNK